MERKTPGARGDRGVDLRAGIRSPITATAIQIQTLMARHALSVETATIVAALAFSGGAR
jgi:hypothetical protein